MEIPLRVVVGVRSGGEPLHLNQNVSFGYRYARVSTLGMWLRLSPLSSDADCTTVVCRPECICSDLAVARPIVGGPRTSFGVSEVLCTGPTSAVARCRRKGAKRRKEEGWARGEGTCP